MSGCCEAFFCYSNRSIAFGEFSKTVRNTRVSRLFYIIAQVEREDLISKQKTTTRVKKEKKPSTPKNEDKRNFWILVVDFCFVSFFFSCQESLRSKTSFIDGFGPPPEEEETEKATSHRARARSRKCFALSEGKPESKPERNKNKFEFVIGGFGRGASRSEWFWPAIEGERRRKTF